jgi:hypothetical protein
LTVRTAWAHKSAMAGVAVVALFAALLGLVTCGAWFKASRVLEQHGALDSRFKSSFSDAATGTALTLALASIAALLGIYASGY